MKLSFQRAHINNVSVKEDGERFFRKWASKTGELHFPQDDGAGSADTSRPQIKLSVKWVSNPLLC